MKIGPIEPVYLASLWYVFMHQSKLPWLLEEQDNKKHKQGNRSLYIMHKFENVKKLNSSVGHGKLVNKTFKEDKNIPVKLNPFVSFESFAMELSISHLPTTIQDPHITVRSITVEPASNPIPTDTLLWAVSLSPESPDTRKMK